MAAKARRAAPAPAFGVENSLLVAAGIGLLGVAVLMIMKNQPASAPSATP